jgi:hypothetical protein
MHPRDTATAAAHALQTYFDTGYLGHAANLAADIQEWLPDGEHAWLRRSRDRAESDDSLHDVPPEAHRDLVVHERASHTQYGPGRAVASVVAQSRNGSST